MEDKYRFEVVAEELGDAAILLISEPEIDNVLRFHGIHMLEALVKVFKILAVEAKILSITAIYTILFHVSKGIEAIFPKHITAEVNGIRHLWLVVFEVNEIG